MKVIKFILIIILFSSCKNQSKGVIEIHLINDRIPSTEGISVLDNPEKFNMDNINNDIPNLIEELRYDVKNHEFIYAGKFQPVDSIIITKPYIEDNEILGIDLKESTINLSRIGAKKLNSIRPHPILGKQYAITVDDKVVQCGYLWFELSSYGSTTYSIDVNPSNKLKNSFRIYISQGINPMNEIEVSDSKFGSSSLIQAFKDSDRILK